MVLVIFLALGYLQTSNGNIAVDMLTARFSPRLRGLQKAAAEALGLAFFALLAWQGWLLAVEIWSIDEYSAGLVRFPLSPATFAMAVGAALTAVCCAARLLHARALADEQPAIDPHAD
jgi:TRAP-type C4-dicarboxylate transport system permease small subunit